MNTSPSPRAFLVVAAFGVLAACTTVRTAGDPALLSSNGKAEFVKNDEWQAYTIAVAIKADAKTIWGVLTRAAEFPTWNTTVVSLEGEIALGETIQLVSTSAPDRTFELTVTEMVPESRMVWEDGMPLGLFAGVRTYTLRPGQDGETIFTMVEVLSGPMLAMFEEELPDMRPFFDTFAADLKTKAESLVTPKANAETTTATPETPDPAPVEAGHEGAKEASTADAGSASDAVVDAGAAELAATESAAGTEE